MSLQKLFNKKVVHLVWISILFSSLLVEPVISADPSYEACKPRKCGSGPNISYPFYVEGARADYCGLHGFKIACQDNKLIYRTFKGPYIVENISYEKQSVRYVDWDVIDDNFAAPSHRSPFEFNSNHANLQFF